VAEGRQWDGKDCTGENERWRDASTKETEVCRRWVPYSKTFFLGKSNCSLILRVMGERTFEGREEIQESNGCSGPDSLSEGKKHLRMEPSASSQEKRDIVSITIRGGTEGGGGEREGN